MGSNWLSIDNNFPTFTGDESLKDQVRLLHDFLPVLIEGLKYQLNNLDSSNWNTKAMKTFQKDTTQELEEAMDTTDAELARLILELGDIGGKIDGITGRITGAESDISWLEAWRPVIQRQTDDLEKRVEGLSADQDALERSVSIQEDGVTIGGDGQVIRLVGTVYLNGTLLQG